MANPDSVSQFYLDSFGNALLARVEATQFNTAANAAITIPILNGGMTNSGAAGTSGQVIIRRVTVMGPTGNLSTANVSITTSNDGNISNVVCANATLSSITSNVTFQDLSITGTNLCLAGSNSSALFVNVNVASGNSNTASIRVYGDVVKF